VKWEDMLRPALRRTLTDRSGQDYQATLSEMVAHLQDGHGYVSPSPVRGGLPIRVEVIDDRLVVTGADQESPFRKGDIISRIDDVPGLEALRDRERYVSGSPQLRRYR